MTKEGRIEKTKKLWQRNAGMVYMSLAREKALATEEESILPELVALAVNYNITSTALFVVHNLEGDAEYKELVLDAVEEQISNLQKDPEDIPGYVAVLVSLWRALVLIWDEENSEKIQGLLTGLYHHYMGDIELLPPNLIRGWNNNLANKVLDSAEERTGVYPLSDVYIRSVYMFRLLMDKEYLRNILGYHKKIVFGKTITSFSKKLIKSNVEAFLAEEQYEALASFLHRTADLDSEEIFGQSKEEFWNGIIGTQHERMADSYLRMMDKKNDDYLLEWKKKIYSLVQNQITLDWCEWAYYLRYLEALLDDKGLSQEAFEEKAREMLPACDYPFEETGTYNRNTRAAIYIFSEVWDRNWNPFFLVDLWGENNLFCYNKRNVYNKNPLEVFQNKDKKHDWEKHQETFWSTACSEEERIRLYMNSPIRCTIDFYATMVEFARRMGEEDFVKAFRGYLLEGHRRGYDEKNAKGRLRFEISHHFYLENRWNDMTKEEREKKDYNALLFNSEKWYNDNEVYAKRILKNSPCTFRFCGFEGLGYNAAFLLVDDIEAEKLLSMEELVELQKKDMQDALEWMKQIRERHEVIEVDKKELTYLVKPHKIKMQQQFAEAVFDTIFTLQNTPTEAFRFLGMIDERKLDKINAFQYILTRNFLYDFYVNGGLKTVWKRFNALCWDKHFTKCQKVNIYMNTYLRAFCGLTELWTKLRLQESDMRNLLATNNEYDKFLFLVDFVENKEGTAFFALNSGIKMQIGGKDEVYRWALRDTELSADQIGESFRVSIQNVDVQNNIIWIGEIYERGIRDRWGMTARRMNDLKNNSSLTYIAEIRKDVESWGMEFNIKNRLEQLIVKFVGLFSFIEKQEYSRDYNLFWCKNILDVFGDRNPFIEPLDRPLNILDSELERMREGIPGFMQAAYSRSDVKGEAFIQEMMEFYEVSPYRLICEREVFETMLTETLETVG